MGGQESSIATVLSFVMAKTDISSLTPHRQQGRTNNALIFANPQPQTADTLAAA
jgi:hypothetical protein